MPGSVSAMIRSAAGGSGGERPPPGDRKGTGKVVVPQKKIKKPKISRETRMVVQAAVAVAEHREHEGDRCISSEGSSPKSSLPLVTSLVVFTLTSLR